jgi:hypothetical protein
MRRGGGGGEKRLALRAAILAVSSVLGLVPRRFFLWRGGVVENGRAAEDGWVAGVVVRVGGMVDRSEEVRPRCIVDIAERAKTPRRRESCSIVEDVVWSFVQTARRGGTGVSPFAGLAVQ